LVKFQIGISTVSSPGDQKKYKVDTGIFKGVPTFVTSKDGIKPKGFLGETSIEGTVLTEKSDEKAKEEFVKKAKAFKLDEFAKEVEAALLGSLLMLLKVTVKFQLLNKLRWHTLTIMLN